MKPAREARRSVEVFKHVNLQPLQGTRPLISDSLKKQLAPLAASLVPVCIPPHVLLILVIEARPGLIARLLRLEQAAERYHSLLAGEMQGNRQSR